MITSVMLTLRDSMNGTDSTVGIWIVAAVLAVTSVILLTGHGSGLIAGYNTASAEDKSKYDPKKLCRVAGGGLAVVTALMAVMAAFIDVLPKNFTFIFLAVTLADVTVMIILLNTVCKK